MDSGTSRELKVLRRRQAGSGRQVLSEEKMLVVAALFLESVLTAVLVGPPLEAVLIGQVLVVVLLSVQEPAQLAPLPPAVTQASLASAADGQV